MTEKKRKRKWGSRRRWTKEEDQLLRDNRDKLPSEIYDAGLLPQRTLAAIACRKSNLGVSFGRTGPKPMFSNNEARAIREEYATNEVTQRDLGEKYKCSKFVIHHIVTGKTYLDAGGPITIHRKGGRNPLQGKLSDQQVRQIRHRYSKGETLAEIGEDIGYTRQAISLIVRRECYAHIGDGS